MKRIKHEREKECTSDTGNRNSLIFKEGLRFTLNDFLSSGAITHTVRVSIKEIINFYQKKRSMVQIVHSTLIAQLSRKNLLIGLIKSTYIILTKYMYLKNDEHSMIFRQIFEL